MSDDLTSQLEGLKEGLTGRVVINEEAGLWLDLPPGAWLESLGDGKFKLWVRS